MPEPVATLPHPTIGLFGKLPARGDFVRLGLPGSFIAPWDGWCQRMVAGSRAAMGDAWLPAWLRAPIWCFALPAGQCGPDAVLGVLLPSVDRAGRYFPLTLAMVARDVAVATLIAAGDAFLASAEAAGLDALEHDLPPDAVHARLLACTWPTEALPAAQHDARSEWWCALRTQDSGDRMTLEALPDIACFIRMLQR